MVEYTVKRKSGVILRRSIRVEEIRQVFENEDNTATLRISEHDKHGGFFETTTLEGYDKIMLRIENEQRKRAEDIFEI